jgi:hypothetical protein
MDWLGYENNPDEQRDSNHDKRYARGLETKIDRQSQKEQPDIAGESSATMSMNTVANTMKCVAVFAFLLTVVLVVMFLAQIYLTHNNECMGWARARGHRTEHCLAWTAESKQWSIYERE